MILGSGGSRSFLHIIILFLQVPYLKMCPLVGKTNWQGEGIIRLYSPNTGRALLYRRCNTRCLRHARPRLDISRMEWGVWVCPS